MLVTLTNVIQSGVDRITYTLKIHDSFVCGLLLVFLVHMIQSEIDRLTYTRDFVCRLLL